MARAKLTSKGQITIPKEVRDALGLRAGDSLTFRLGRDGTVAVEAEKVSLAQLAGVVRTKIKGVSVERMNDAIRRRGGRAR